MLVIGRRRGRVAAKRREIRGETAEQPLRSAALAVRHRSSGAERAVEADQRVVEKGRERRVRIGDFDHLLGLARQVAEHGLGGGVHGASRGRAVGHEGRLVEHLAVEALERRGAAFQRQRRLTKDRREALVYDVVAARQELVHAVELGLDHVEVRARVQAVAQPERRAVVRMKQIAGLEAQPEPDPEVLDADRDVLLPVRDETAEDEMDRASGARALQPLREPDPELAETVRGGVVSRDHPVHDPVLFVKRTAIAARSRTRAAGPPPSGPSTPSAPDCSGTTEGSRA